MEDTMYLTADPGTGEHIECTNHQYGARLDARAYLIAHGDTERVQIWSSLYGLMETIVRRWEVIRTATDTGAVDRLTWPIDKAAAETLVEAKAQRDGYTYSVREWDGNN